MKKIFFLLVFSIILFARYENDEYSELREISVKDYYASEFIVGIAAYWDGKNLINSNYQNFIVPESYLKDFPPYAIKGLLSCDSTQYEVINDVYLKKFKCAKFYVYEVEDDSKELKERLKRIENYIKEHNIENIKILTQHSISNTEELISFYKSAINRGYNGIVLNKKISLYDASNNEKILRIKKFYKDTCTISKVNLRSGRLLDYDCSWPILNGLSSTHNTDLQESIKNKGDILVTLNVGSGFSKEQIQKPLKVGDKILFKYYKLDRNGIPMHSIFLQEL